jgi:hypothetical protein
VVTSDLDALDGVLTRTKAIEDGSDEPMVKLKALHLQARVLEKKLHLAGASPEAGPATSAERSGSVVLLPALKEP